MFILANTNILNTSTISSKSLLSQAFPSFQASYHGLHASAFLSTGIVIASNIICHEMATEREDPKPFHIHCTIRYTSAVMKMSMQLSASCSSRIRKSHETQASQIIYMIYLSSYCILYSKKYDTLLCNTQRTGKTVLIGCQWCSMWPPNSPISVYNRNPRFRQPISRISWQIARFSFFIHRLSRDTSCKTSSTTPYLSKHWSTQSSFCSIKESDSALPWCTWTTPYRSPTTTLHLQDWPYIIRLILRSWSTPRFRNFWD